MKLAIEITLIVLGVATAVVIAYRDMRTRGSSADPDVNKPGPKGLQVTVPARLLLAALIVLALLVVR